MTKKPADKHTAPAGKSRPARGETAALSGRSAPMPVTEWEKGENKKPAPKDDSPTA